MNQIKKAKIKELTIELFALFFITSSTVGIFLLISLFLDKIFDIEIIKHINIPMFFLLGVVVPAIGYLIQGIIFLKTRDTKKEK